MPMLLKVAAGFCLVLHLGFFALEAVRFPKETERFKAEAPAAELKIGDFEAKGADNGKSLRIFAFNMGCYNFLIAAGVAYCFAIWPTRTLEARAILSYLCCVMGAAGIVLGLTASWLWPAAALQSGAGLICLVLAQRTKPA